MQVRKPAVAGYFYPGNEEELREQLEKLFLHKLGPGRLPRPKESFSRRLAGIVSPHAGYVYSGPVAAHGYLELAEGGRPKLIVVMGPNHHAVGAPIALSDYEAWETPLGTVDVDLEISRELVGASGVMAFDNDAHRYEHSIEVQLPFLQFLFDSSFKLVPISMLLQNPETSRIVGEAVADVVLELEPRAYIIASSDFTHYEEARKAANKDKYALEKILSLDLKGLYDVVIERDVSICGPGPIMSLIAAAQKLNATKPRVLKYANSGDVTGDYSSVVCYASIAFYYQ